MSVSDQLARDLFTAMHRRDPSADEAAIIPERVEYDREADYRCAVQTWLGFPPYVDHTRPLTADGVAALEGAQKRKLQLMRDSKARAIRRARS